MDHVGSFFVTLVIAFFGFSFMMFTFFIYHDHGIKGVLLFLLFIMLFGITWAYVHKKVNEMEEG